MEKLRDDSFDDDCCKAVEEEASQSLPANRNSRLNILGSFRKSSSVSSAPPTSIQKKNPFRFAGDGVEIRGKLIGFQEVPEPTGEQMCQDAMVMCKALQKSSGKHKQRVILNVCLKGLFLTDEKSGDLMYTYPVTKISYVTRDTRDARAFGFVFGTPETKHRFYAIKSAQNAIHAVSHIRDMFHIAFETKKVQMEDLKQDLVKQKTDLNGNAESESVKEGNLIDLGCELEEVGATLNTMESAEWGRLPPGPMDLEDEDPNHTSIFLMSSSSSSNNCLTSSQDSSNTHALLMGL